MRSTSIWVAVLLAGGGAVVAWQRSQIASLRGQLAQQAASLEDNRQRVADISLLLHENAERPSGMATMARLDRSDPLAANRALLHADERRLILNQYRDILAQMNLPPATAARLEYLFEDRIDTVLDAQDAAEREGFAEGSEETARVVTLAIADVDRDIATLLGPEGSRRLNLLSYGTEPAPSAPPAVVTVAVATEVAPQYVAPAAEPAASYDTAVASPSYYYPVAGYIVSGFAARPFRGERSDAARFNRPLGRAELTLARRGR